MTGLLLSVVHCIRHQHDPRLLLLAGLVCIVGIYGSFAIASHASRMAGRSRRRWGLVSVVASGCTAWATHFIVLLAFRAGIPAAFEPILTALSLACAIMGIGLGVSLAIGTRRNWRKFQAGLIMGVGVAALHYLGQMAYVVQGTIIWNLWLVALSIPVSLPIFGAAMVLVASRNRKLKAGAAPLLLLAIAILHFCGMAAMTLRFDTRASLPVNAVSPAEITPIVAGVCMALLVLAVLGLRSSLAAAARIRQDRRRLENLADVALEGLLIADGDIILAANNSIERLAGFGRSSLAGRFVSSLLPGLDLSTLPEKEEREAELVGAKGQTIPVRVLRSQVQLGHKRQTVIAVRDQRERLRTEAKIRTLAFNDPLTGLPNRTRFYDLLAVHAASRRERDGSFAVLMIDLDRFKPVNDVMGHAAGDQILRQVAERLTSALRDGDVVARLGGDEFAVLQLAIDSAEAAQTLATRIVEEIGARPFLLEGQAIHIGASVGLAFAPEDGTDPAEILRNADLALYAAKADGRATLRRFNILLQERTRERQALEAGLRHALANDQLELHYQPLVDAQSGRITSAEALVRWHHPARGLVSPTEFISLAEETGMILPLGAWVLRTACAEAATWPDGISVAVNLSPAQFRDEALASNVASALRSAGLSPRRLELEITEGVLLTDEKRTLETLAQLRAAGVRISMDDFGTGYSSLSYLHKFPFDRIKIDQSFVHQVPANAECMAIVRAIITMGACLGMSTTVEGVQTAEQYDFCTAAGCDAIQGYFVSQPLSAQELALWLVKRGHGAEPALA